VPLGTLEQTAAVSTLMHGLLLQGGGISQVRPVQAPVKDERQSQTTLPPETEQVPPLRQGN